MKKILVILLVITTVFTLSACRGGSSGKEDPIKEGELISLKYWNSLTGADGDIMRALVKQFNEEHKDKIEVNETFVNEVDYYTNINLLVPQKRGPDVAIMHSYLVQSYAKRGILTKMSDMVERSAMNTSDYITDVVNSLYYEEELYGVPLDVHTVGIYYNKTLLEKYDLEVPKNREELLNAARVVQEGEGSSNVWGLPISTTWPSEWIFTTALYQNGGMEIDESLDPAYNSTEGAAALKSVADIIHTEALSPKNLSVDQDLFLFQSGKALFHIQGSWMLRSIIDSGINFGVLPMSQMFGSDAQNKNDIAARSHTFVIPTQNRDMQTLKEEAIMTFVKYMGDHSYIWAEAGQIPASNIARATDEYLALPYHSGFGNVDHFRVAAQSPTFHEAFSPVYSRVTAALSNQSYNATLLLNAAAEEGKQLMEEANR